jgi:hypothetical protein
MSSPVSQRARRAIPLVVAALMMVSAPAAQAHDFTATISCTKVTYAFKNFPSANNTVNEKVLVDGNQIASTSFSFSGSSGGNTVTINVPAGTHTVTAHADWNTNGKTGSDDVVKQVSCSSPPPPPTCVGTYAVGDLTAGGPTLGASVYFWGSQWWKRNSLSGGRAPAAFKGYVTCAPGPLDSTACGKTWTADPGNSGHPPGASSGTLRIVVTSRVTKKGPNISGNIVHVVDVSTGGAGTNPGHTGTGNISNVVC